MRRYIGNGIAIFRLMMRGERFMVAVASVRGAIIISTPRALWTTVGGLREVAAVTLTLCTVDEVAVYLHLHPVTVRKMAKCRELPFFKVSRVYRFSREEIDR
jgi:excisionase family DNA binding protein